MTALKAAPARKAPTRIPSQNADGGSEVRATWPNIRRMAKRCEIILFGEGEPVIPHVEYAQAQELIGCLSLLNSEARDVGRPACPHTWYLP